MACGSSKTDRGAIGASAGAAVGAVTWLAVRSCAGCFAGRRVNGLTNELRPVPARPVDFAAAFAGSTGYARFAATAGTVLDVQKSGSNIGTVTFAAASATPVFALASATSFAAGDRLGIVNEDPADAALAGSRSPFAGTRGS